jgi:hypothetical protein
LNNLLFIILRATEKQFFEIVISLPKFTAGMLNFHAERAAMEERGNPADNIN